jgi:glycosyltransferase involved in cell wall biosynthesis
MIESNPLVTCLCLTRNRREWLPKAIACFQLQTYANRELLIVADGEEVADLIPENDARIRLVYAWSGLSVGRKRNFGCGLAQGSVIAHWDDDDYSAPERLSYQVWRLRESGKAVTGFHSLKFTDGKAWWQYQGASSFVCGTTLCYERGWWLSHPFEDMQVMQDENFATRAASCRQLAADGELNLMYATIHAGNTSPRSINGDPNSPYRPLPGFTWSDGA